MTVEVRMRPRFPIRGQRVDIRHARDATTLVRGAVSRREMPPARAYLLMRETTAGGERRGTSARIGYTISVARSGGAGVVSDRPCSLDLGHTSA